VHRSWESVILTVLMSKKETDMKFFPALLVLFILIACGTPFDEDYWDNDLRRSQRQEERMERYVVNLEPVSALSFSSGSALLDFQGNAASMRIEMQGVSENLVQGQVLITARSCEEIIADPPTTGAFETKNYTYIENGTRAALFSEISLGDSVQNNYFVVYAQVKGTQTVPASGIFPLACGPIVLPQNAGGGTTATAGAAAGGIAAGTTGEMEDGIPAGVVGGVTAGVVGGIQGGVIGGVTAGTVGGVTGGTLGGTAGVGGVVGGTVPPGGTGGTAASGGAAAAGGFAGGAGVGGIAGGATGGPTGGTTGATTGATIGTTFGGAEGF
jgi:hypothetical protein